MVRDSCDRLRHDCVTNALPVCRWCPPPKFKPPSQTNTFINTLNNYCRLHLAFCFSWFRLKYVLPRSSRWWTLVLTQSLVTQMFEIIKRTKTRMQLTQLQHMFFILNVTPVHCRTIQMYFCPSCELSGLLII